MRSGSIRNNVHAGEERERERAHQSCSGRTQASFPRFPVSGPLRRVNSGSLPDHAHWIGRLKKQTSRAKTTLARMPSSRPGPCMWVATLTGRSKAVHSYQHFSGGGRTPVVTTSSTAEEECPVRETYWMGGLKRSSERSEGGKLLY